MLSPKDRIILLYKQLTEGCQSEVCGNPHCKTCPSFEHNFTSNTDAAKIAIELAKNFSQNVCDGMDPKLRNPTAFEKAKKFTEWFRGIMTSENDSFNNEEGIKYMTEVFSDEDIFCNIFRSNDDIITSENIDLNDSLVSEVSLFLNKHSSFFCGFYGDFWTMAHHLVYYAECDGNCLAYFRLRGLLMACAFNLFFEDFNGGYCENFEHFLDALYPNAVDNFNNKKQKVEVPRGTEIFLDYLPRYPSIFHSFIEACHTNLTLSLCYNPIEESFENDLPPKNTLQIVLFFNYFKNYLSNKMYVPDDLLYNDTYTNDMLAQGHRSNVYLIELINETSSALDLHFKYGVLRSYLSGKMDRAAQRNFQEILFRGTIDVDDFMFTMEVDRDNIIQDTLDILAKTPTDVLERRLKVVFRGEVGVDAGGLAREFFFNLTEMFSPDHGMFEVVNDRHWFRRDTVESPIIFGMLGTIVALAIYNGIMLPVRFPIVMFKKLCGTAPQLRDLEEVDPDVFRTLTKLQESAARGEDVSDIGLTFAVDYETFGEMRVAELVKGGAKRDVTNENLDEYIKEYVDWALTKSIARSYNAFERGYNKLCDRVVFKSFSAREMSIIVSGEEVFDWGALKSEAKYSDGYTAESQAVIWFWEVFEGLSEEKKVKFLLFSTGSDKAPIGGLGSVHLVIQRTGDPDKLPVAHTCFNIFALPDYPDKEILKKRLLIALENTVGFGLK